MKVSMGIVAGGLGLAAVVLCAATPASAGTADPNSSGWTDFVIRDGGSPPTAPAINYLSGPPSSTEFVISEGGQKAGLGTNAVNGATLGSISTLAITRLDDPTRFAAGSGPAVAPYINIWITDSTHTKFAVVGNEPSNPGFQPLYHNGYNLTFGDLSNKVAKIYETSDKSWLPNNGVGLTFADLANYTILAPTTGELTAGWAGLTGGAPRELGTDAAFGVNWIFGDTLSNYVSGDPGYQVADAKVAVPEPAAALLFCTGLLGLGVLRRRGAGRKAA